MSINWTNEAILDARGTTIVLRDGRTYCLELSAAGWELIGKEDRHVGLDIWTARAFLNNNEALAERAKD